MQTSTQVSDATQERIETLALSEHFLAVVWMKDIPLSNLSATEQDALQKNLRVVSDISTRMAASMLKGIFKYGTKSSAADRSPTEWYEYAVDEQIDALLEFGLMRESMRQPQKQLVESNCSEENYFCLCGNLDHSGCDDGAPKERVWPPETLQEKRERLDAAAVDDFNKPYIRPAVLGGERVTNETTIPRVPDESSEEPVPQDECTNRSY